jgi:hypothetical protein
MLTGLGGAGSPTLVAADYWKCDQTSCVKRSS